MARIDPKTLPIEKIAQFDDTVTLLSKHYEKTSFILNFKCNVCSDEFIRMTRCNVFINVKCKKCENNKAIDDKIDELRTLGWDTIIDQNITLHTENSYICKKCGNRSIWNQTLSTKLKSARNSVHNSCRYCYSNAIKHKTTEKYADEYALIESYGFKIVDNTNNKMILSCNNCDNVFNRLFLVRGKLGTVQCPKCFNGYKQPLKVNVDLLQKYEDKKNSNLIELSKKLNFTLIEYSDKKKIKYKCNICDTINVNNYTNMIIKHRKFVCSKCLKAHLSEIGMDRVKDDLLEEFKNINFKTVSTNYIPFKQKQMVECLKCNHIFEAFPYHIIMRYRENNNACSCPKCYAKKVQDSIDITNNGLIEKIKSFNEYDIITPPPYNISKMNIDVYRHVCGHHLTVNINNLANRLSICKKCSDIEKGIRLYNHNQQSEKIIRYKATLNEFQKYKCQVHTISRINNIKYKDIINPDNLPIGKAGSGLYQVDHILSIRYCFDNNISIEDCASIKNLRVIPASENISKGAKISLDTPEHLLEYLTSEAILATFNYNVKKLSGIEMISKNIGYNESNDVYVILAMFDDLEEDSIIKMNNEYKHCYIILENEWKNNMTMFYNKIQYWFKMNQQIRIHGRNCDVDFIEYSECEDFLDRYHLDKSIIVNGYYVGGFYKAEIVAVMVLGKINEYDYEFLRYCVNDLYIIPGIASKMMNYFKNNVIWDKIESYSYRRLSNSRMYFELGFEIDEEIILETIFCKDGENVGEFVDGCKIVKDLGKNRYVMYNQILD